MARLVQIGEWLGPLIACIVVSGMVLALVAVFLNPQP